MLAELKPTHARRIFDLVREAGGDHERFRRDITGTKVVDPSKNIHMNSKWTFVSDNDVLIACIWWRELTEEDGQIVHRASSKHSIRQWSRLQADIRMGGGTENLLTRKIGKAQEFDRLISRAKLRRLPVRVVTLVGYTPELEQAAVDSSDAHGRLLDDKSWWVHEYDPYSGDYLLVRDVSPPPEVAADPFEGAEDPADDTQFFDWLDAQPLTATQKDVIVKARVGQGWFRDALVNRWGKCSLSKCPDVGLLIASHIKPWRHCETRAERLSPANGLLLTPNLDKLFDAGLISFDERGYVLISKKLGISAQLAMSVKPNDRLHASFDDMRPYMAYHRAHVFKP